MAVVVVQIILSSEFAGEAVANTNKLPNCQKVLGTRIGLLFRGI